MCAIYSLFILSLFSLPVSRNEALYRFLSPRSKSRTDSEAGERATGPENPFSLTRGRLRSPCVACLNFCPSPSISRHNVPFSPTLFSPILTLSPPLTSPLKIARALSHIVVALFHCATLTAPHCFWKS